MLILAGTGLILVNPFSEVSIRNLISHLYEHTMDRLATRWDRFSWFGVLPVSENGVLGRMPDNFNSTNLLPALEAILIEALEPRQNRKTGDDLSSVEYIQRPDPEIHVTPRQNHGKSGAIDFTIFSG